MKVSLPAALAEKIKALKHYGKKDAADILAYCVEQQIGWDDLDIWEDECGVVLNWCRLSIFVDISPGFDNIYRLHKGSETVFSNNRNDAQTALVKMLKEN